MKRIVCLPQRGQATLKVLAINCNQYHAGTMISMAAAISPTFDCSRTMAPLPTALSTASDTANNSMTQKPCEEGFTMSSTALANQLHRAVHIPTFVEQLTELTQCIRLAGRIKAIVEQYAAAIIDDFL